MKYENQNTSIDRKTILLRVWGDDSFFNSRNLDVYITKLRDYLKDDPANEIITIKELVIILLWDRSLLLENFYILQGVQHYH